MCYTSYKLIRDHSHRLYHHWSPICETYHSAEVWPFGPITADVEGNQCSELRNPAWSSAQSWIHRRGGLPTLHRRSILASQYPKNLKGPRPSSTKPEVPSQLSLFSKDIMIQVATPPLPPSSPMESRQLIHKPPVHYQPIPGDYACGDSLLITSRVSKESRTLQDRLETGKM